MIIRAVPCIAQQAPSIFRLLAPGRSWKLEMWRVQVARTSGAYKWRVQVARTSRAYKWRVQVARTKSHPFSACGPWKLKM